MAAAPPRRAFLSALLAAGPWSLLARASTSVGALVSVVLLGRWLGPAEYGRFVLVANLAQLSAAFLYAVVGHPSTRFYAAYRERGELPRFYATLAKGHGAIALALLALGAAGAAHWMPALADLEATPARVAAALGLVVLSPPLLQYVELLRFAGRPAAHATAAALDAVLRMGFPLAAIALLGARADAALGGLALYAALGVVLAWGLILRGARPAWGAPFDAEFLRYGAPFLLSGLLAWILGLSDRYWIEHFAGAADAGRYAALYQFASAPLLAGFTALMLAAEPLLYQHHERSRGADSAQLLELSIRLALALLVPLTLAIGFLHPVVPRLLGRGYEGPVALGWLVAAGTLASALAMTSHVRFLIERRSGLLAAPLGAAAATSLAANALLVPRLGLLGAASACVLAYGAQLALTMALYRRVGARYPLRVALPLLAAGALAAAAGEAAARVAPGMAGRALGLGVALALFGAGAALAQRGLVRRALATLRAARREGGAA